MNSIYLILTIIVLFVGLMTLNRLEGFGVFGNRSHVRGARTNDGGKYSFAEMRLQYPMSYWKDGKRCMCNSGKCVCYKNMQDAHTNEVQKYLARWYDPSRFN